MLGHIFSECKLNIIDVQRVTAGTNMTDSNQNHLNGGILFVMVEIVYVSSQNGGFSRNALHIFILLQIIHVEIFNKKARLQYKITYYGGI